LGEPTLQALAIAAGILLGIFSGLLPGVHANTVSSIVATLPVAPDLLLYIIVALLGAHLVFQFFPSIFLSVPDESVVVSVLPGHQLALEGRGREALLVCASSLMIAAVASALLLPASLYFLPAAYSLVQPHLAAALALASAFLLVSERQAKKIALASFVFLLSGAIGIASLRGPINDPLFPSFCGLFAGSGILLSFTATRPIPRQSPGKTELDFLPYVAAGVLLGMLSDLLPGIAAPAQIAVFASVALSMQEPRKFLALVASIAASHTVFAFAALTSIGKAREGSIAILDAMRPVMPGDLPAVLGVLLLSIGVCAFLLMILSKRASLMQKIDAKALNIGILAYLVFAVAVISGATGLLLFSTCTAAGLLPPLLGIRRTHVMGLIIVPSIMLAL
jgi:putative membrane protein